MPNIGGDVPSELTLHYSKLMDLGINRQEQPTRTRAYQQI
jgi:hypothetical protein